MTTIQYLRILLSSVFFCTLLSCYSQNLASLLTEKNINSTFSIIAYDETTKEWGIAVATNNICVGNSTIYIQPEVGAFSVIAETKPKYGVEGLKKLMAGKSVEQAITEIKEDDENANYRQVSGIDSEGNVFAFTGESLKYWGGTSSEIMGEKYVVIGNQLADNVLSEMSKSFENSQGTLAERLLTSLINGQNAGGQISGKQSAALVVKGANNKWYNQIDLRVDNSKKPIKDLQILLNYYYGRIQLNQAFNAYKNSQKEIATSKLRTAESMLEGWTGIYSRIAALNLSMGFEDDAINWIKKGLQENSNWSVNIPAFYCLKDNPRMKSIITPNKFDIKDWENAIAMLSNLGRELQVIELAEELISNKIDSSYLYYLLGRGYYYEKLINKAIPYLEKAINMDNDNIEAQKLLEKIKSY